MKIAPQSHISTTQSVDLIASIVGDKLDIAGEEARCLAITGALSQVTRAFYSRQQVNGETIAAVNHGDNQTADRRYRDRNGVIVHVIGYEPATKPVIFMRPGYEHPCARPLWQVQQHFTRLDV